MKAAIRGLLALALLIPALTWAAPDPDAKPPGRHGPVGGKSASKSGKPGPRAGARKPGAARPGRPAHVRGGKALLRSGMTRMASQALAEDVAANPTSPEANISLAIARARLGRCDDALDHFLPFTGNPAFGLRAALMASHCSSRLGMDGDAVWFDLIALDRRPESQTALGALALDADRLGDTVLRDVAWEELLVVDPRRDQSLFAEAALALRHGDLDTFDAVDALWTREGRPPEEMARLRARSWMDLDDPAVALTVLTSTHKVRKGAEARILIGECERRLGMPAATLEDFAKKAMGKLAGSEVDAVSARALVDTGALAEAAALLESYPPRGDDEIVASRWYLARAQGDAAAEAEYAAQYAQLALSPLRTLDQLIPVAGRA